MCFKETPLATSSLLSYLYWYRITQLIYRLTTIAIDYKFSTCVWMCKGHSPYIHDLLNL